VASTTHTLDCAAQRVMNVSAALLDGRSGRSPSCETRFCQSASSPPTLPYTEPLIEHPRAATAAGRALSIASSIAPGGHRPSGCWVDPAQGCCLLCGPGRPAGGARGVSNHGGRLGESGHVQLRPHRRRGRCTQGTLRLMSAESSGVVPSTGTHQSSCCSTRACFTCACCLM
jgi:hypothetical protein